MKAAPTLVALIDTFSLVLSAISLILHVSAYRPFALLKYYGLPGLFYLVFGSRSTWRAQAHVLGTLADEDALNFKKSVQDECTIISVAVGYVSLCSTYHVAYPFNS